LLIGDVVAPLGLPLGIRTLVASDGSPGKEAGRAADDRTGTRVTGDRAQGRTQAGTPRFR